MYVEVWLFDYKVYPYVGVKGYDCKVWMYVGVWQYACMYEDDCMTLRYDCM